MQTDKMHFLWSWLGFVRTPNYPLPHYWRRLPSHAHNYVGGLDAIYVSYPPPHPTTNGFSSLHISEGILFPSHYI